MKIYAITLRIIASLFFIILGLTQAISVYTATDAGGACSANSDCDSGLCQSSICIGKKIGQACSDDDQCTTGQCENSFCVCDDQDKQKSDHCENTLYGGYGGTASGWKCMDSDQDPDTSRGEWNFCKKADYLQSLPKESTADVKYPVEKKILMGYACDESASCISAGIGEKCNTTNSVSTPDNDPWYSPDKMLRVCTADFDEEATDTIEEVCTKQYGPGDWTVVVGTGELEGLRVCKNTSPNWTPTTLEEMRKYVATTNNLVQTTFLGFDISTEAPELVTPETKIGIPGVFFTNITKATHITTDESGSSWLNIPFLGEFISAIYKYSVGLISLIAVMVLIISGVQIITSAGNSEVISSAKHRIVSSVIAIVITAGSYTILYTVNPDLVNLKNLKILVVPQKLIEIPEEEHSEKFEFSSSQEQDAILTQASNTPGAAPVSGDRYVCGNTGTAEQAREDCKQWCTTNTDKSTWPEYTKGTLLKTEIQKRLDVPGIKLRLLRDSGIPNKLVEPLKQVGLAARNHPEGPFTVEITDSYRPLARAIQYVCDKYKKIDELKKESADLLAAGQTAKSVKKKKEADTTWNSLGPVLGFPGANAHNNALGGAVDVQLLDSNGEHVYKILTGEKGWFAYYNQNNPDKAKATRILAEIFYQVPGWQRYMWEIWHFDYNYTIPKGMGLRTNTCTKPIIEPSRVCPP